MKKSLKTLFACTLCAALVTTAFSSVASAQTEKQKPVSEPLKVYGNASIEGDRRLHLTNVGGETAFPDMVLNISDETRILDAVSGFPVALDQISEGETVYAYISQVMTMSLPPMTNATMILCNIPADYKVPSYETVKSLETKGEGATLTAVSGNTYEIPADASLLPYLTRNIVTLGDLTAGATCLIWTTPTSNQATKIVIFPGNLSEGWTEDGGTWYYYSNGTRHTGWLKDNGSWYYLNPETGAMVTGFLTLEGKTYYMEENGRMLTTGKTFTPDSNGVLH